MKLMCPIEHSVALLGGKWKLPILHSLIQKSPTRFKELERQISGITPKMLTTQLRSLEESGLIARAVFSTIPPTVEYSLTDLGRSIQPMMSELEKWGLYHQQLNKSA